MGDFGFNPFDGGGDLGELLGLVSSIIAALTYLWNVIVAIAQYLYSILVVIAEAVVQFMVAAERLMVHLFESLYSTIIKPLIDELVKIEQWIAKVLAPVIRVINRIRAWYNKYIFPYQKLALQIISKIRQFLAVFKLFGAKWAQKLDADFARIQSYITTSIVDVIATLNTLTSWIQLATDPTQIIRGQFWANTAFTGVSQIYKAANVAGMKPLTAQDHASSQASISLNTTTTPPVTRNADGSTAMTPEMQTLISNQNAAAAFWNPTVPNYTRPVA